MAEKPQEALPPSETILSYDRVRQVFAEGGSIRHADQIHTSMASLAPHLHEFKDAGSRNQDFADALEEEIAAKQAELDALRKDRRSASKAAPAPKAEEKSEEKEDKPAPKPAPAKKPAVKVETSKPQRTAKSDLSYEELKRKAAEHGFLIARNPNPSKQQLLDYLAANPTPLNVDNPTQGIVDKTPAPTFVPGEDAPDGSLELPSESA